MKRWIVFLCAAALLGSASAWACGAEDNTPEKLAKRQRESFERKDANRDGVLDASEFSSFQKWELGGREHAVFFRTLDTDTTESLTFDEWKIGFSSRTFGTKGCGG
ncbi:MAG TPA: hypothetical protein DCY07_08555 [Rhodospirillaceae bacterium]|nr:hypothetical protein [Rhodospirillaceae bacterium]